MRPSLWGTTEIQLEDQMLELDSSSTKRSSLSPTSHVTELSEESCNVAVHWMQRKVRISFKCVSVYNWDFLWTDSRSHGDTAPQNDELPASDFYSRTNVCVSRFFQHAQKLTRSILRIWYSDYTSKRTKHVRRDQKTWFMYNVRHQSLYFTFSNLEYSPSQLKTGQHKQTLPPTMPLLQFLSTAFSRPTWARLVTPTSTITTKNMSSTPIVRTSQTSDERSHPHVTSQLHPYHSFFRRACKLSHGWYVWKPYKQNLGHNRLGHLYVSMWWRDELCMWGLWVLGWVMYCLSPDGFIGAFIARSGETWTDWYSFGNQKTRQLLSSRMLRSHT